MDMHFPVGLGACRGMGLWPAARENRERLNAGWWAEF
jgi:hypothetical protein